MTVTAVGELVLSTVLTAAFHVPKTALGGRGVPPDCQSPALLVGSVVMSVMKSAGNIGRSHRSGYPAHVDVSVPAWSPSRAVVPTWGFVTPQPAVGVLHSAESW